MENNDNLQLLIDSFIEYRKILVPIQETLYNFSQTYNQLKDDIQKLDVNLENGMQEKLNEVLQVVSRQAEQSFSLSQSINKLSASTDKYNSQIVTLVKTMQNVESRLSNIANIERQAEEQIEKLDALIENKKVNYNVKELQKSLETYKTSVEKVSDFINKDIADVLTDNNKKIEIIRQDNQNIMQKMENENKNIEKLIETYKSTNKLLETAVQNNDVNEQYIFEILDKWATSRKIKIKK